MKNLFVAVLLPLFLLTGCLEPDEITLGPNEFDGYYEGTFAGDYEGTFTGTIEDNFITGSLTREGEHIPYATFEGQVQDGEFNVSGLTDGESQFIGNVNQDGEIDGSWFNDYYSGSFEGIKLE